MFQEKVYFHWILTQILSVNLTLSSLREIYSAKYIYIFEVSGYNFFPYPFLWGFCLFVSFCFLLFCFLYFNHWSPLTLQWKGESSESSSSDCSTYWGVIWLCVTNVLIFIIIVGHQDKKWRDITVNNFKSKIGLMFCCQHQQEY